MIEIKLSFASIDEAIAYLQGKSTTPATVKVDKPAAAPKPQAQPKAEAPAQAPAAAPSAPEAPAASTASSGEPASLDYDRDVKPLIVKLAASKGRDSVVAVLGKFGVAKGTELAAEQLADAKAALTAALEA